MLFQQVLKVKKQLFLWNKLNIYCLNKDDWQPLDIQMVGLLPDLFSWISYKGYMKRLLLAFLMIYKRGMQSGDFYEEPMGEDFVYPDW